MPKVSILFPVYNVAPYLRFALDSLLQQTYTDFEVIILNDGSTDISAEIISSYHDSRLRFYQHPNMGLTKTLNRGLELAQGQYLARMDPDDWSHPQRLAIQIDYLDRHPDIFCCGTWIAHMDSNNKRANVHRFPLDNFFIRRELLFSNPLAHGSAMWRHSPTIQYSTDKPYAEDLALWTKLITEHQLANIPRVLYHWRVNPKGVSHQNFLRQQDSVVAIQKEYQKWYLKKASSHGNLRNIVASEQLWRGPVEIYRNIQRMRRWLEDVGHPELLRYERQLQLWSLLCIPKTEWRYLYRQL